MKKVEVESIFNSITVEGVDISSFSGGGSITQYSFYIRDYKDRLENQLHIELDVFGQRSGKFPSNILFISDQRCVYVKEGNFTYDVSNDFYLEGNIIVNFLLNRKPVMSMSKDGVLKELV